MVGIVHTNYVGYAKLEKGQWAVPIVEGLNKMMCKAYCHKVSEVVY